MLPLLGVAACAVAPPTGPMILATPPQGQGPGPLPPGRDLIAGRTVGATLGGVSPQAAAGRGNAAVGSSRGGHRAGRRRGRPDRFGGRRGGDGARDRRRDGAGRPARRWGASNAQIPGPRRSDDAYYVSAYKPRSTGWCYPARPGLRRRGGAHVAPYTTPYPQAGYGYSGAGLGYYGVPDERPGFGVYRGWGWAGGYARGMMAGPTTGGRPDGYGRPNGDRRR